MAIQIVHCEQRERYLWPNRDFIGKFFGVKRKARVDR